MNVDHGKFGICVNIPNLWTILGEYAFFLYILKAVAFNPFFPFELKA